MNTKTILPISLCITDEKDIEKCIDVREKLGTKHKLIYMIGINELLKQLTISDV